MEKVRIENNKFEILQIIREIYRNKLILFSSIFSLSFISIIYALILPDIYKSQSILIPSQSESSLSRSIQSYGGLASLAGINLGSASEVNYVDEAIEKVKSLSFFAENILPNIFLADLMAYHKWDSSSKSNSYNSKKFLIESNTWLKDGNDAESSYPTEQEAYLEYLKIISIKQNKETGFVYLSVEHQSPIIAKEWNELIFNKLNSYYRYRDKEEAGKSLDYLNKQLVNAQFTELKQALVALIQNQIQKLSLVEANSDYVFQYIDPPVINELKNSPKRLQILILGGMFGFFLGVILILINFLRKAGQQ